MYVYGVMYTYMHSFKHRCMCAVVRLWTPKDNFRCSSSLATFFETSLCIGWCCKYQAGWPTSLGGLELQDVYLPF